MHDKPFRCTRCGGFHRHHPSGALICPGFDVPWKRPAPMTPEEAGRRTAETIIRILNGEFD